MCTMCQCIHGKHRLRPLTAPTRTLLRLLLQPAGRDQARFGAYVLSRVLSRAPSGQLKPLS